MLPQRELSRREKVLLMVLALLSLLALYFFVVHQPVTTAIQNAEAEGEVVSTEITILEAKVAKMAQMKAAIGDADIPPIPDYDNQGAAITFLHSVLPTSTEYQVSFGAPVQVVEGRPVVARQMSLEFHAASYEQARTIVDQLEACPFRCLMNQLQIVGAKEKNPITKGPVTVRLSMLFFENKPLPPAPPAEG